MKITLLVSRSGPAGAFNRGDVIDVDKAEAKRMFESDPPQAAPYTKKIKPETRNAKNVAKGKG